MKPEIQTVVGVSRNQFKICVATPYSITLLIFCFHLSFGQKNFAPDLKSPDFKNNILLLMVSDSSNFLQNYERSVHLKQKGRNLYRVIVKDTSIIRALKNDNNILFIDRVRTPHVEGSYDLVNPSINKFNLVQKLFPGVNGSNSYISVKEEGFDKDDIDITGRSFTTSVSPTTTSQHATQMAVLIAGGGNSSSQGMGAAHHAVLTSSSFDNLTPDDNTIFTTYQVNVQNHSYGVGIENYYGIEALAYDQQVNELPQLLHVFSSGNSGTTKPTSGTYANVTAANLTGTFKQSKNTLSVTAIDTSLTVNTLNSRGPAYDGRLKPELTAFGPGGTSEAAAITTSAVVLIQEKFQSTSGKLPDASMVKAILAVSADDIGVAGIDYNTGYGNLNIYQALTTIEKNQLQEVVLNSQDNLTLPLSVPTGVRQMRLAVSWIDPPASINADKALVNDIDAWLDDGNDQFHPWVLSSYPHEDSLLKLPDRKPDHLNNTEFITIDDPSAGTYSLHLTGGTLQAGQQKVSIAYFFDDQPGFTWTYPVSSDIMKAGENQLLGWAVHSTEPGNLFYKINNEAWQFVKSIDFSEKFMWTPPSLLAKAQLKMELDGQEYLSDEFLISPQLQLTTEFICADSIRISWTKMDEADTYDIYAMGDQYMEKIESTADTAFTFYGPTSNYFAITPVQGATQVLRSAAMDYTKQGASCYLNFFEATRTSVDAVNVNLLLGSLHHVQSIKLIRQNGSIAYNLLEIMPQQLTIEFTDSELIEGLSVYQAEVKLTNGVTILSQPVEITIEGKGAVIVWPNPVTDDEYLKIVSSGEGEFRLINQLGQIVITKQLNFLEDEMDLQGLLPGLYFYQKIEGKSVTDSGRLIKR